MRFGIDCAAPIPAAPASVVSARGDQETPPHQGKGAPVMRIHRLILAGACSLALGIGLAACGGSSNDSSTNSATPAATGSSASSGGSTATTGGTAAANTSSSGGSSGGY